MFKLFCRIVHIQYLSENFCHFTVSVNNCSDQIEQKPQSIRMISTFYSVLNDDYEISHSLMSLIMFINNFFESPEEIAKHFEDEIKKIDSPDIIWDLLELASQIRPLSQNSYENIQKMMAEKYPQPAETTEAFDFDDTFSGDYSQFIHWDVNLYKPIKFDGFDKLVVPNIATLGGKNFPQVCVSFIKSDDLNSLHNYFSQPEFDEKQLYTMIKYAAYFGSVKCFKYLLLSLKDLDPKDEILASCAVAGGNFEIIHILEQKHFSYESAINTSIVFHRHSITDWIIQNYPNAKPSYIACVCSHNYPSLLYLLSNHIGDINESLWVGDSDEAHIWMPISVLCTNYYINIEILKLFIKYGADPNNTYEAEDPSDLFEDSEKFTHKGTLTPLLLICHQRKINLEAMWFLLEEAKASPTQISYLGTYSRDQVTPLYALCTPNRIVNHEAIELLLQYTNDVDNGYTYYEDGYPKTPLYALCQNIQDNSKTIKMLIERGAKVDIQVGEYSDNGHPDRYFTPLYAACQYGNLEVIKLLIENGAKIEHEELDFLYGSPFAVLCASPKVEITTIDYMIEKGADPNNILGDDKITPLTAFIQFNPGKIEEMKYLIDKGADVNIIVDDYESTPLHIASENGNVTMVKVLLEKGADKNARNDGGKTPYDVACNDISDKSNITQIQELLKP